MAVVGVQVSWQHHHPGLHPGQRDQFAYQQSCLFLQFPVLCVMHDAGRDSKHPLVVPVQDCDPLHPTV